MDEGKEMIYSEKRIVFDWLRVIDAAFGFAAEDAPGEGLAALLGAAGGGEAEFVAILVVIVAEQVRQTLDVPFAQILQLFFASRRQLILLIQIVFKYPISQAI